MLNKVFFILFALVIIVWSAVFTVRFAKRLQLETHHNDWADRCFQQDGVVVTGRDKFGISVDYCLDLDVLKKV